jgi:hypothetical protein
VGTTSYTLNTSASSARLQARLGVALPAGVSLAISVAVPSGATSSGFITLTTSYQNLTSVIPASRSGTYTITHRLTATSAAGVKALQAASVTFRLQ